MVSILSRPKSWLKSFGKLRSNNYKNRQSIMKMWKKCVRIFTQTLLEISLETFQTVCLIFKYQKRNSWKNEKNSRCFMSVEFLKKSLGVLSIL